MSLFQSETNTRQLGETGRVLLWDRAYCPLRVKWERTDGSDLETG